MGIISRKFSTVESTPLGQQVLPLERPACLPVSWPMPTLQTWSDHFFVTQTGTTMNSPVDWMLSQLILTSTDGTADVEILLMAWVLGVAQTDPVVSRNHRTKPREGGH